MTLGQENVAADLVVLKKDTPELLLELQYLKDKKSGEIARTGKKITSQVADSMFSQFCFDGVIAVKHAKGTVKHEAIQTGYASNFGDKIRVYHLPNDYEVVAWAYQKSNACKKAAAKK